MRWGARVCSVLAAAAVLASGTTTASLAADAQPQQWYLSAMKAGGMWKESTGEGVKVAVIDTGVNPDTPSLRGQVLADEVPEALAHKATEDYTGHGTTMAELIAGTGAGGGLKGLAPGAKIVPYRIATKELKGAEAEKAPKAADIIRAVADSDVKIMSMSFGNHNENEDELAAIKYAQSKGKLMIAAAGNDAEEKNLIGYPAAYPYVVGVAATDESGKAASFSEHGNYIDLAAPGLNMPVWCDSNFRSYCDEGGGTSSATALTSASAALIWSAHPDWTANQVLNSLIDTAGRDWARDDPSTYLGYGLIRPRKVLEDKNYDPGPANADPLAKENATGALDEAGDPVSASSTAPSAEPSKNPEETPDADTSATASDADASDNSTLWVTLGGVAAVLVIGGGAFAVYRSRRSA
ncbi:MULTISPECIES: S8 family serine peptidase [unclassified Streptomyces]|uniref:S8 family serine peptidase n=1 Tax=unclassified Streptomyces TaxID=2593676 RepID=UPI001F0C7CD3|nr:MULTISPECIES: S8 family serine peptidase [unclassified Streptomyces]